MTITVTTLTAGPFTPTGLAQSLPFDFKVFAEEELEVVQITDAGVETTVDPDDYTVDINTDVTGAAIEGGSVELGIGAATVLAGSLYVRALPSYEQGQVWDDDTSSLRNLNEALDRAAHRDIKIKDRVDDFEGRVVAAEVVLAASATATAARDDAIEAAATLTGATYKLAAFSTPEEIGGGIDASAATNVIKFQDLFGTPARGRIQLDAGVYDLNDAVAWTLSYVRVIGVPGKTKIRTTHRTALYALATIRDVVFEDIIFETTSPLESEEYFCVLLSDEQTLINVKFIRCGITTTRYDEDGLPDVITNVGGMKIIAQVDARVEGLHWIEGTIRGTGGMGIEFQNHPTPDDTVQRFADIIVTGLIEDTGLASVNGQAVSLSGAGTDAFVDITAKNNLYCVLENVGFSNSRFSGRVSEQTRVSAPLSFTNRVRMDDIEIVDFQCLDECNGDARLHNLLRPTLRNNRLNVSGGIIFRDVNKLQSYGDVYTAQGAVAMSVEATASEDCKGNHWDGLSLTTQLAVTTALQFFGAGAMHNTMARPQILPGVAGSLISNVSSASENWVSDRRVADGAPSPQLRTADVPSDANWNMGDGDAPAYFDAEAIQITSSVPLTATRTVTLPNGVPRPRRVRNSTTGGQSITLAMAGGGTTVSVATGATETVVWTAAGLSKV